MAFVVAAHAVDAVVAQALVAEEADRAVEAPGDAGADAVEQ